MNTIPEDVIQYFIKSFIDYESLKNFGMTSKGCNAMAVRSPKYLNPFLSAFFTKILPEDEKISMRIRKVVNEAFNAIITGEIILERPITIKGQRLFELPGKIRESSPPLVCFKLLLQDVKDVNCASDSQNASLLPFVRSVELSDEPELEKEYESENSFSEEFEEEDHEERIQQQHNQFVSLLERMPLLHTLILSHTSIQIWKKVSKPCPSIKILQMEKSSVLNSESAEQFFKVFPKIEKIGMKNCHNFAQLPSTAQDSSVKELVFFDTRIDSRHFRALLKSIPTIEIISFLRPVKIWSLFTSIKWKRPEPVLSVKELHIFEPAEDEEEAPWTKEYVSKKLSFYFPNLQKVEIM